MGTADGREALKLPTRQQVRAGGCYYALGARGQAARLHPVAPAWLGRLDPPLHGRDVDLESALCGVGFRSSWLLHVPARGKPNVTGLDRVVAHASPATGELPDAGPDAWRTAARHLELAVAPAAEAAAWQAWLEAAGPLSPPGGVPPQPARRG